MEYQTNNHARYCLSANVTACYIRKLMSTTKEKKATPIKDKAKTIHLPGDSKTLRQCSAFNRDPKIHPKARKLNFLNVGAW